LAFSHSDIKGKKGTAKEELIDNWYEEELTAKLSKQTFEERKHRYTL
jgi:hypothetical protein